MKKLTKTLMWILLASLLLSACGREELRFDEDPFVIGKIKMINDETWRYVRKNCDTHRFWDTFSAKPAIVAPSRTWQVGDTIQLADIK